MRARAAASASTSYSTKSARFHSSQSRIWLVCGQRALPKSSSIAMTEGLPRLALQRLAHHVVNRSLHFLNPRNVIAVHYDREIRQLLAHDLAAVITEKCNRQQFPFTRLFQRHNDVARSTAGGNCHHRILRTRLRNQLAQKNRVAANIVGDGRNVGGFKRQRHRGNGGEARWWHHTID